MGSHRGLKIWVQVEQNNHRAKTEPPRSDLQYPELQELHFHHKAYSIFVSYNRLTVHLPVQYQKPADRFPPAVGGPPKSNYQHHPNSQLPRVLTALHSAPRPNDILEQEEHPAPPEPHPHCENPKPQECQPIAPILRHLPADVSGHSEGHGPRFDHETQPNLRLVDVEALACASL